MGCHLVSRKPGCAVQSRLQRASDWPLGKRPGERRCSTRDTDSNSDRELPVVADCGCTSRATSAPHSLGRIPACSHHRSRFASRRGHSILHSRIGLCPSAIDGGERDSNADESSRGARADFLPRASCPIGQAYPAIDAVQQHRLRQRHERLSVDLISTLPVP